MYRLLRPEKVDGLFLEKEDKLDKVVFVLFTQHDLETYKEATKEANHIL